MIWKVVRNIVVSFVVGIIVIAGAFLGYKQFTAAQATDASATPSPTPTSEEEAIDEQIEEEVAQEEEQQEENADKDATSALRDYLTNEDRTRTYAAYAEKSGPLIVGGLYAGHFGKMTVSDAHEEGKAGPISVSTETDPNRSGLVASAWVWQNADDTFDYTKSMTLSLYTKDGGENNAAFFGPNGSTDYWNGSVMVDGVSTTTDGLFDLVKKGGWESVAAANTDKLKRPTSLRELQEHDEKVWAQFIANMQSWSWKIQ